jgi:hypothetical protein
MTPARIVGFLRKTPGQNDQVLYYVRYVIWLAASANECTNDTRPTDDHGHQRYNTATLNTANEWLLLRHHCKCNTKSSCSVARPTTSDEIFHDERLGSCMYTYYSCKYLIQIIQSCNSINAAPGPKVGKQAGLDVFVRYIQCYLRATVF